MGKSKRHIYTQQQRNFIENNVKGTPVKTLTEMFNIEFGTNLEARKIRAYLKNHDLKNGINTIFVKGQTSFNKGKKWDDFMPKESQKKSLSTTFKKGVKPPQTKELGETYLTKDGYLYIKVKEDGPRFGREGTWQPYHHIVWKEKYGEIPKNHTIVFLDQNKANFDITNLKLVSRSELLIINKSISFSKNKDVSDSITVLAKLIDKQNKVKSRNNRK